jgi:hypothetical protein
MSGTQEEKSREETERGENEVSGGNCSRQAQWDRFRRGRVVGVTTNSLV